MSLDDGIHDGVPFKTYLEIPAVSNSGVLNRMKRSAAYCRATEGEDFKATKDMRTGSAVNDLVLVPDLYPERFRILQRCIATLGNGGLCKNTGQLLHGGRGYCGVHAPKGGEVDATDLILIDEKQDRRARDMADAVLADADAAEVLRLCPRREVTLLWTHEATGIRCKGRVDLFGDSPMNAQAWDLKKSVKATPDEFSREILKRGYHSQAAWYDDGLRTLGIYVETWGLIVVNDQAADDVHEVGTYPLMADALELGREQNRALFATYAECKRTGVWRGFGRQPLSVPAWALADRDDDDNEAGADGSATEAGAA